MTVTPAKLGEVLKCGLLRRAYGVPVRRSAPVVLAERVTDATGVVVLAVIGGAGTDRWPLLVIALAGVVGIVVIVRTPLLGRFAALGEAPEAARTLLRTPLLVGMTAVSAASWFCECLAAYVCVRGLRLDLTLADTIVVFSLGSLAGALSFLPGGIGVAETSMAGLMRALGDVSKAGAAAATVLIRLATLWFAVAIGLVGLAVEERLALRQRQRQPVSARRSSARSSTRACRSARRSPSIRSSRRITWLVRPRISARLRPTGLTCSRRPS